MDIQDIIRKKRYQKQENLFNTEDNHNEDVDSDSTAINFSLRLTSRQAHVLLKEWANNYIKTNQFNGLLFIDFDDDLSISKAKTKRLIESNDYCHRITIGTKELSFEDGNMPVKDMDFLQATVALYHEIAHYEQDMTSSKTEEDFITEFSTYGNKYSYFKNWPVIGFEIKAEHSGVMVAWDRMRQTWPAKNEGHYLVDDLMLKRLTERAIHSNYCLKVPGYDREKNKDVRFESREQVDGLFNKAEVLAPIRRHRLADEFTDPIHCNDDLTQMMVYESGGVRPEYNPFYISLMHEESGPLFDKKMASLIAHIYPDRKNIYPKVNFNKLTPEKLFGMPVPETKEEIFDRITPQSAEDIFCSIEEPSEEWDYKQIGREMEEALKQIDMPEAMTL